MSIVASVFFWEERTHHRIKITQAAHLFDRFLQGFVLVHVFFPQLLELPGQEFHLRTLLLLNLFLGFPDVLHLPQELVVNLLVLVLHLVNLF